MTSRTFDTIEVGVWVAALIVLRLAVGLVMKWAEKHWNRPRRKPTPSPWRWWKFWRY